MKREWFALAVVVAVLVLLPGAIFGYQAWRNHPPGMRVINIMARAPEQGGFSPDHIRLVAGEPVQLRFSSPDVVHGAIIPGLGVDVSAIGPGKVTTVVITSTVPGRYAFACTRWCSVDHWRMRGVIEVVAARAEAGETDQPTAEPPFYQRLGIDIDAMPPVAPAVPREHPSTTRGGVLGITLPPSLRDATQRRATAPAGAFTQLRVDPALASLQDDEIWDLVAWAWLQETTSEVIARTGRLYARDCAACHGPEGRGDGPAGRNLPGLQKMDPALRAGPADFTNAARMLNLSDAVLQGKILRGGMGTGMPEFGSLHTDEEFWALVATVRGFLFNR